MPTSIAPPSAARPTRSSRRGTNATPTASSDDADLHDALGDLPAAAVEAPDRERRVAAGLEADRAVPERRAGRSCRSTSARAERERRAPRPRANSSERPRARAPAAAPQAVGREQRQQRERGELRQARGHRRARRARTGGACGVDRRQHERRGQRVVRPRVRRVDRERERDPGVGEHDAELRSRGSGGRSGTAAPTHARSNDRGRGVRGRQVVPAADPGPDQLERHVGEVEQRAVGVALRRCRSGTPP